MKTIPMLGLILAMSVTANAVATTHYVDLNCTTPSAPFTDWSSAATNIQDAINAADSGDRVVVTNGIYTSGGRQFGVYDVTNRAAIHRAITVISVNGPLDTWIVGSRALGTNAIRCAWVTNGAMLSGFTLTNGSAGTGNYINGGGVSGPLPGGIISNCIVSGNIARGAGGGTFRGTFLNCIFSQNHAGSGGAAADAVLIDCLITNNFAAGGGGIYSSEATNCSITANFATNFGGGTSYSILVNSRVIGNVASQGNGGGTYNSTLFNCLALSNSTPQSGGGTYGGSMKNCVVAWNRANLHGGASRTALINCTVVYNFATNSVGGAYSDSGAFQNCIIYFNDAASVPNLMGKMNRCCTYPSASELGGSFTNEPLFVNPANNNFHLQSGSPCINAGLNGYATGSDLDGNPRISGGLVDLGAFEYQSPASALSYYWAQQYGFPTDGSADWLDSDNDGLDNWKEFQSGTNPTNSLSLLVLSNPVANSGGVQVSWQSVNGKSYFVERSSDLSQQPAFSIIRTNIYANSGTITVTDSSATNDEPYFYRIGVQ